MLDAHQPGDPMGKPDSAPARAPLQTGVVWPEPVRKEIHRLAREPRRIRMETFV